MLFSLLFLLLFIFSFLYYINIVREETASTLDTLPIQQMLYSLPENLTLIPSTYVH